MVDGPEGGATTPEKVDGAFELIVDGRASKINLIRG